MNPSSPYFIPNTCFNAITLPTPSSYEDLSYMLVYRKELVDNTGEFLKRRFVTVKGQMLYLWLYYANVETAVCRNIETLIKATRKGEKIMFRPFSTYPRLIPVMVCKEEGYRFRLIDDTHLRGYIVIQSKDPIIDALASNSNVKIFFDI